MDDVVADERRRQVGTIQVVADDHNPFQQHAIAVDGRALGIDQVLTWSPITSAGAWLKVVRVCGAKILAPYRSTDLSVSPACGPWM